MNFRLPNLLLAGGYGLYLAGAFLLAIAGVWPGLPWHFNRWARPITILVTVNLVANLIFLLSHPIFTPYYVILIDMLSLWTLLFATLDRRGERAADNAAFPQPAPA